MRKLGLIATLFIFVSFVSVLGRSGYLRTFNTLYGTTGETLDNCVTCHGISYTFNSYGADFDTKFLELGNQTDAFKAIESFDSDKDGDTNIIEINTGTFPGNPASNLPVEPVTWGQIKSLFE